MQGQIDPEGWRHPAIRGKPRPQTVHQVMTATPVEMSPDADLADVVSLMLETNARSVPLADDGTLVGIISRRDVLRAVAQGELA